ncbi:hypothetical protein ACMFMG_006410 [Clarireedia jacksonii]
MCFFVSKGFSKLFIHNVSPTRTRTRLLNILQNVTSPCYHHLQYSVSLPSSIPSTGPRYPDRVFTSQAGKFDNLQVLGLRNPPSQALENSIVHFWATGGTEVLPEWLGTMVICLLKKKSSSHLVGSPRVCRPPLDSNLGMVIQLETESVLFIATRADKKEIKELRKK